MEREKLMEEFFNSSEEIVQRLESKRSENAVHMQSEQKAGRPLGRLVCTKRAHGSLLDRLVDRSSGRPTDMKNSRFNTVDILVDRVLGSVWARICLSFQNSDFISELETNPIRVS